MRTRAVAAIGAAAVALAGCGGSGSSGGKSSDPVAGVRATLREFANDLLSGNYSAACDLFTASARSQIGGSNCINLLAQAMKAPRSQSAVKQSLPKIPSWPVSVHGNTATTPNVNGGSPTPFVKQGGRWLIGSGSSSG